MILSVLLLEMIMRFMNSFGNGSVNGLKNGFVLLSSMATVQTMQKWKPEKSGEKQSSSVHLLEIEKGCPPK